MSDEKKKGTEIMDSESTEIQSGKDNGKENVTESKTKASNGKSGKKEKTPKAKTTSKGSGKVLKIALVCCTIVVLGLVGFILFILFKPKAPPIVEETVVVYEEVVEVEEVEEEVPPPPKQFDEQKQAIFMMNYAQYVIYKLRTYNNILALEDEYKILKDELNLQAIKDASSVKYMTELMDAIDTEMQHHEEQRKLIKTMIEKNENEKIYNGLKAGMAGLVGVATSNLVTIGATVLNPLFLAMSTIAIGNSLFDNYKQYQISVDEFDKKSWEMRKETLAKLNDISKSILEYSHNLIQQYNIDDSLRLSGTEMQTFFDVLSDSNSERRYRNLQDLSREKYFPQFSMFWHHLAKEALVAGDNDNALSYYQKFEETNFFSGGYSAILRHDRITVEAFEGKITILLNKLNALDEKDIKNRTEIKNEILDKLKVIEANSVNNSTTNNWNDYYFCALVYTSLGDIGNAKRLLERNVRLLERLVENRYNIADFSKIYSSEELPYDTNYDGLALNRTLLQSIDAENDVALESIQKVYDVTAVGASEALWLFDSKLPMDIAEKTADELKNIKLTNASGFLFIKSGKQVISCKIPLQWLASSSTELEAVFVDSDKNEYVFPMSFDEDETKKLHKSKKVTHMDLIYSSEKIEKPSEDVNFIGIRLKHPIYPLTVFYDLNIPAINLKLPVLNELNLGKDTKDVEPYAVTFNNKAYLLGEEDSVNCSVGTLEWFKENHYPIYTLGI